MAESVALYRCVCGTDVPLKEGNTASCPKCGRHQRISTEKVHGGAETILLSGSRGGARSDAPTVAAINSREGSSGGSKSPRPNLAGRVLDHFELIEELGRGGMGTVYRALDRSLERYVALKVLDSEEARNQQDLVEAFVHEARTQARVNHPGIATIYYIGKFEEMTYFAMEIIAGTNLEARVKSGPLPFRQVIDAGLQVVQALREAKERGVIHRDIKPGNIILTSSGRVKVTDFGLSKTEKGGLQITGSRQITGTPYYIAPEQARGETTDFRTDIYSLGATLYHLAYGKPPFDGDNFMAVIAQHLSDPVRFPAAPPQEVPPGFPYVLERMLAKDPRNRFESYEDLEEALLDLRPEAQIVAAMGQRGAAALVDYFAILLAALVIGMGLSETCALFMSDPPRPATLQGVAYLMASLICIFDQAIQGSSIGKRFGKLRISHIEGRRMDRPRLFWRGLLQYLPIIVISAMAALRVAGPIQDGAWLRWAAICSLGFTALDFLWAFTNPKRRTLHDFICKTWVLDRV